MKKLLFILMIAFSFTVNAAPYAKVGLGTTTYDYDNPVVDLLFDDSATAMEITIGHKLPFIASWISGEIEYTDFGKADKTFIFIPTSVDAKGVTAWLVGDWHVGHIASMPFDLSARLGIAYIDADASVFGFSASDSDTGAAYGVGAKLWLASATAITLDVKKRNADFDFSGASFAYDPMNVMLGVQHQF